MTARRDFDLIVVGAGAFGSLTAMIARRLGMEVCLVERGIHPRFAIGESTSPLTNLLLEELADRYDLPRLRPLCQWGTWTRAYPDLPVGLKRGFTFYHHQAGKEFAADPGRERQLLVAASPNDDVADTHWRRAEFDHFLVREAQGLGVDYLDRVELQSWDYRAGAAILEGERRGAPLRLQAPLVIDASGPRGALTRLLKLEPPADPPWGLGTQALFSHFTGVGEFAELSGTPGTPPYPPDASALHHVFDGGWAWVLRFDDGVTSAGVAAEDRLAEELGFQDGEPAWHRFLDRFPSIGRQFASAVPVQPFFTMRRVTWESRRVEGEGWLMLPGAAAFIDPLFSTGFVLSLLGVARVASAMEHGTIHDPAFRAGYSRLTRREASRTARLIRGCYRAFPRFDDFTSLSMLYFAAASFSEMSRRLRPPSPEAEFLLGDRPEFDEAFDRLLTQIEAGEHLPLSVAGENLAAYNVAGLCRPDRRNWYPVDVRDCVEGAHLLGVSPDEVMACLLRLGLGPAIEA